MSGLILSSLSTSGCQGLATTADPADGAAQIDEDGGGAGSDSAAPQGVDAEPLPPWESLIDVGRLHQIRITVAPSDVKTLETLHGDDIPCEVAFDDVVLKSVGISQKGSVVSGCRCLKLPCTNPMCMTRYDDKVKPGLKLKFDFDPALSSQRLYGLKGLVLNNAHQDISFLSAHLIYEVYRRAGRYAPHTAFAQVVINGIPQGLYNLEEDSDKQFLQRNFGNNGGNFYEGSGFDFVSSPDGFPGPGMSPYRYDLTLKKEAEEMRTRADVYAAGNAILGATDADFEARVSKVLDLDGFIDFWAIDAVFNWRDNYVFNVNNYLLYDNPRDGRLVFLPHGADGGLEVQEKVYPSPYNTAYPPPRGIFYSQAEYQVPQGLLAQAVQDVPSLAAKYKAAVARVSSAPVWDTTVLLDRIKQLDGLLTTMARPDPRMTADIAQFRKYRPTAERFINDRGTSRGPQYKAVALPAPAAKRVPVILSSDLFWLPTAATSDDLIDIALLSSMPDVDLKGVVLDNAMPGHEHPQYEAPGAYVLAQIQALLRRRTPAYVGLGRALTSLADTGKGDEERFQGAVAFILDTLQRAVDGSITIVTTGSLRDVAAAFNRQPELFRAKVGKLLVFAGDAAPDPQGAAPSKDYNVGLDHFAFAAIMKSGLPIFWAPRQDGTGNAGHASGWSATLADVLGPLSGPPLQYFVNAFDVPQRPYGIGYLIAWYVDDARKMRVFQSNMALSAAGALAAIADKTVTYDGSRAALAVGLLQSPPGAVFGFSPVDVTVSETGAVTSYGAGGDARRVNRFDRLVDQGTYAKAMSLMTGNMLTRLVLVP